MFKDVHLFLLELGLNVFDVDQRGGVDWSHDLVCSFWGTTPPPAAGLISVELKTSLAANFGDMFESAKTTIEGRFEDWVSEKRSGWMLLSSAVSLRKIDKKTDGRLVAKWP